MGEFDRAPALTILNQCWWALVDPLQARVEQAVSQYYHEDGYFKDSRKEHHLLFHGLNIPGTERWGVAAAAQCMLLLAPEFSQAHREFSRDLRHRLFEAMLWDLRVRDPPAFEYAIGTGNLFSQLFHSSWYELESSPRVDSLEDLLSLRRKFVARLQTQNHTRALPICG